MLSCEVRGKLGRTNNFKIRVRPGRFKLKTEAKKKE
jgi:hypothetical protein